MTFTATIKGHQLLEYLQKSGTHNFEGETMSFAGVTGRPVGYSMLVQLGDESVCIWHADGDELVCQDMDGNETCRDHTVSGARAHSVVATVDYIKRRAKKR